MALLQHVVSESLGSHTITATFAGDGGKYGPSTGTGTLKVLAPTKITADVLKASAGSSVSFGAKLVRSDTLAPLEGKTLSFLHGNDAYWNRCYECVRKGNDQRDGARGRSEDVHHGQVRRG